VIDRRAQKQATKKYATASEISAVAFLRINKKQFNVRHCNLIEIK
jgi:hypothetical protein